MLMIQSRTLIFRAATRQGAMATVKQDLSKLQIRSVAKVIKRVRSAVPYPVLLTLQTVPGVERHHSATATAMKMKSPFS